MKIIFALLTLLAMANAAVSAPQSKAEIAPAALPAGHMPITAASDSIKLTRKGKVLEMLDSSMYTYLRVTGDNGSLWLAAYKTNIAKGDIVSYSDGAAMNNFYSKALNRTFDRIVFVDRLEPAKK